MNDLSHDDLLRQADEQVLRPCVDVKAQKPVVYASWSGGGLPGIDMHAGVYKALCEAALVPSYNSGTSAGAFLAAAASAGMDPVEVCNFISFLSDSDVKQKRFLWKLRMPWVDSFLRPDPIRGLIRGFLPDYFHFMDQFNGRLSIHATDEKSGKEYVFGPPMDLSGEKVLLEDAILASMSISGIWPAVKMWDRFHYLTLTDGGTVANLPISHHFATLADVILLIVADSGVDSYQGDENMLTRLLRNVDYCLSDQVNRTIRRARVIYGHKVHVLRLPFETPGGALKWDHELICKAYEYARGYIDKFFGGEYVTTGAE